MYVRDRQISVHIAEKTNKNIGDVRGITKGQLISEEWLFMLSNTPRTQHVLQISALTIRKWLKKRYNL